MANCSTWPPPLCTATVVLTVSPGVTASVVSVRAALAATSLWPSTLAPQRVASPCRGGGRVGSGGGDQPGGPASGSVQARKAPQSRLVQKREPSGFRCPH